MPIFKGMDRATKRPQAFAKPAYWTSDPPPAPGPSAPGPEAAQGDHGLSPTRYGDWVKDGVAIDF